MKVFKFVILWIAVSSLWGEVIVLKDGTKIECTILTTKNDSLIVINRITEKVDKIAFDAILRI